MKCLSYRYWSVSAIGLLILVMLTVGGIGLAQDDTSVTLDTATVNDLELNPALAYDSVSSTALESLFLGLTDVDPITGLITPELATDWSASEDGMTWTFRLRSDVNWMQYDPASGEADVVRPVVAGDFVYGIKRSCDPRLGTNHGSYILADTVAGCHDVLSTASDETSDSVVFGDTIWVFAPDDTTLVIKLTDPTAGLPAVMTLPVTRAVPWEMDEAYGYDWASRWSAGGDCTVSSGSSVNLRAEPGAGAERVGGLEPGQSIDAVAQTTGTDGYVWWYLDSGDGTHAYVRSDVVKGTGDCDTLPDVSAYDPNAPGAPAFPLMFNGPFGLIDNGSSSPYTFVRNTDLPSDLQGDGNIDVVNVYPVEGMTDSIPLYEDNKLDAVPLHGVGIDYVQDHAEKFPDQFYQQPTASLSMFGYAYDKPPFDNVHARRAFSAIIDRDAFVKQVQQGRGVPMIHFTPPSMAHAESINKTGVGFDPEYAAEQLDMAGYPGCEGFPNIEIITYSGAGQWAEFWAAAAEKYLGCDPALIQTETLDFSALIQAISAQTPTESRPNAWMLSWGPDYPDASQWYDRVPCGDYASSKRTCMEVDDLIDQAALSTDPEERDELYAEIEEAFFGPEGEFPIAPIFLRADFALYKTWYTGPFETDGLFGGSHWGAQSIDMEAKLAARGE